MLSQTAEYALRAMAQLASEEGGAANTGQIANLTGVPAAYLAKVLQALRRAGLITARRGVGGGVTLARRPQKISLLEIVSAVQPITRSLDAPKGKAGALLAPLNNRVDTMLQKLKRDLAATSLADVTLRVIR